MAKPDDARYLVAGCTPWARRVFDERLSKLPGQWSYLDGPPRHRDWTHELGNFYLRHGGPPRAIFFLHWRWQVPEEVVTQHECLGVHLGRLPEERGGSPLQWRILARQEVARLTLFRLTPEVDAGPIYGEEWVPLHGAAEAIYARAMDVAARLIGAWLDVGHTPTPQRPLQIPRHPRRGPEESRLSQTGLTLTTLYDHIRMVDAPGYPHAFLDYGGFRFTFRRAVQYDGRIEADVTITPIPKEEA